MREGRKLDIPNQTSGKLEDIRLIDSNRVRVYLTVGKFVVTCRLPNYNQRKEITSNL